MCAPLKTDKDVSDFKSWLQETWVNLAMVDYPYKADFLQPLPRWPIQVPTQNNRGMGLASNSVQVTQGGWKDSTVAAVAPDKLILALVDQPGHLSCSASISISASMTFQTVLSCRAVYVLASCILCNVVVFKLFTPVTTSKSLIIRMLLFIFFPWCFLHSATIVTTSVHIAVCYKKASKCLLVVSQTCSMAACKCFLSHKTHWRLICM